MAVAKQVAVRVLAACLAFVPAMMFGVAAVNKYYGYYQSWGAVIADFSGQGANTSPLLRSVNNVTSQRFSTILGGLVTTSVARQQGYTVRLTVAGQQSHLRRTVYIYLPPQYFQKSYAHYRFPVLELFPGFPGSPQDWINVLGVTSSLDRLVRNHQAKPVVLVMPDTNGNRHFMMQCLNLPNGPQNSTFLAVDVPAYVSRTLRVQPPGAAWGAAGYSEGGYCTANLGLRYGKTYGYAGVLSGYFSPLPNLVGRPSRYVSPFGHDTALRNANTPMAVLPLLSPAAVIPQFWIGVGASDGSDITVARAFQQLLLPRQPKVQLVLAPGGGHTMYTWRGLLAPMLEWITPRLTAAAQNPAGAPGVHQGSGQPVPAGKPLPVSAGKPHPVPAGKPQPGPAAKALGAAGRHRP
jgi:enterochelin esterase-like enzyme